MNSTIRNALRNMDADKLHLEKLGSENFTDDEIEALYLVVAYRFEAMKPTSFTAVCDAPQLANRLTPKDGKSLYGYAIVGRLLEMRIEAQDNEPEQPKSVYRRKKSMAGFKPKPVVQCDYHTHEKLAVFPSITEAAKVTGVDDGCIGQCANGHTKSAGGYWWRFAG